MKEEERQLLMKCAAGFISKEEVLNLISPVDYSELKELLDASILNNDSLFFEALFWEMPNRLSETETKKIYQEFLLEPSHREHENIATAFQADLNNDPANIPVLLQAIDLIPEYLDYDDSRYSYIRKLIYAIGAHPEPYNTEALQKLARETADALVKDMAEHQVVKRKVSGRWEASGNAR